MRFSRYLYLGQKARKRRFAILQGLRQGMFQPEVYVITLPNCGKNILDIYPSAMLLTPGIREQDLLVLGAAVTYWEALELVREMVDEQYQKTGGFCFTDKRD